MTSRPSRFCSHSSKRRPPDLVDNNRLLGPDAPTQGGVLPTAQKGCVFVLTVLERDDRQQREKLFFETALKVADFSRIQGHVHAATLQAYRDLKFLGRRDRSQSCLKHRDLTAILQDALPVLVRRRPMLGRPVQGALAVYHP